MEIKFVVCFIVGFSMGIMQLCRIRLFNEHERYLIGDRSDFFSPPILLMIFSFILLVCIFIEDPIAEFTSGPSQDLSFNPIVAAISIVAILIGETIAWLINKPKQN